MNIVSTPDSLLDERRHMTCMQFIRTLTACRPDITTFCDVTMAHRTALESLARHCLELHDGIANRDAMIRQIVDDFAPNLVA
ncbi:MAG: hypothetical protein ACYDHM_14540 [Acidiferrobacterales bacterium]